jgi:hypothetical protein
MAQTGEGVSSFFGKDLDLSASVLVWDKLSRCPGGSHFVSPPGWRFLDTELRVEEFEV